VREDWAVAAAPRANAAARETGRRMSRDSWARERERGGGPSSPRRDSKERKEEGMRRTAASTATTSSSAAPASSPDPARPVHGNGRSRKPAAAVGLTPGSGPGQ